MKKVTRGITVLLGCLVACMALALGDGVSADPLIGALDYAELEDLAASVLWMRLDQAECWAIPLDPPTDYYAGIDDSTTTTLRTSLHELIDDHIAYPYSTSDTPGEADFSVDTWDIIALADAYPEAPSYVLDVYLNGTFERQVKGGLLTRHYDREHSWPKSYGFNSEKCPAYTDCHHLFAAYSSYNQSRSNNPYGECDGTCKPTEENLQRGGDSVCNMRCTDTWEVWDGRRGDVARAMFYMAIRYEGDVAYEPDLELTDTENVIRTCAAWSSQGVAYMGLLSALLEWHEQDPVDDLERRRNSVVYLFQGNRNPFVDHPEWVEVIFGS